MIVVGAETNRSEFDISQNSGVLVVDFEGSLCTAFVMDGMSVAG